MGLSVCVGRLILVPFLLGLGRGFDVVVLPLAGRQLVGRAWAHPNLNAAFHICWIRKLGSFFFLPWSCCERSKQRLWAANSRPRTDRSPTAPERVQLGDENRTATSEHEETVLYLSCLPPSSPSSSPRYLRSAPVHSERLHEGVPRRRMAHQYLLGRRHSDQVVPVSRMPASREKGHRGQSLEYDRQEVFAQPV